MAEPILNDSEFQKFSRYIKEISGINLHKGKKELLKARLGKILRQRKFTSFRDYYNCVVSDTSGNEVVALLDCISTNMTYFFREPQHFELLCGEVLPEILKRKVSSRDSTLQFWSAGCASGEEAYSITIAVREALCNATRWQTAVLATDLSSKVLTKAKQGVYEKEKLENVSHELKKRYFQKGINKWEGHYRVKREIRDKISFQRLNFIEDFQFKKPFDVIFCRNVMIYFDKQAKDELVGKICRNLARGGYLFIGHAESLNGVKHTLSYIQPSVYKKT